MAAGDLTTLAAFKSWGEITISADDAVLSAAITSMSAAITNYINRNIIEATYSDVLNGMGGDALITRQTPVTAVSSLVIDGRTIPASPMPALSGYRVSPHAIYLVGGSVFTRGVQNVAVAYTAGYPVVPADIVQALNEWLNVVYKERDRVGYLSKSLAGETVSFDAKAMPSRVTTYLESWVRRVPIL